MDSAGAAVIYRFGDYCVDTALFQITNKVAPVAVEPQVLDLLIALLERRGRVVTRDELLDTVWKGKVVSDTTLSSRIKSARRAIGDDGARQTWIRTVHGRGFRFVGRVEADGTGSDAGRVREPSALARPATRYARSGDLHIAYQVFGDGPVNLIKTPGFVSHIDNYWDYPAMERYLRRLGSGARVAMFDKRGTGLSDKCERLPGMDERMDDVRAVMDAAGFDTAFVMGVSEGGSLATLFAASHPQRCDGVILYGAFARFRHWFPDQASLQALFDYIRSDWGSGKSLPHFAPGRADDPQLRQWWGKFERLGATPGAAIALMTMNSRIDISDVLPSVGVPALVIHRTGDTLIDVEAGRQLGAQIPGARYLELPGADHLPFVGDNTDEIIDTILDFLSRPSKRRPPERVLATLLLVRHDADDAAAMRRRIGPYHAQRIAACADGLAAAFDGPARALECARVLAALSAEQRIGLKIGVHAGEVDPGDERLDSLARRVAADVAARARADEVLVSRTVNDLVAGSGIALKDHGVFHLPSIDQAWRLFRLAGPASDGPAAMT